MIHSFYYEYKGWDNYIPFLHYYESFKPIHRLGIKLSDKYEAEGWECRYLKSVFTIDGQDYVYNSPSAKKVIFVDDNADKETKVNFPPTSEIVKVVKESQL